MFDQNRTGTVPVVYRHCAVMKCWLLHLRRRRIVASDCGLEPSCKGKQPSDCWQQPACWEKQPADCCREASNEGKRNLQSYVRLGSNVCSRILKRMFALAQNEKGFRTMVQDRRHSDGTVTVHYRYGTGTVLGKHNRRYYTDNQPINT